MVLVGRLSNHDLTTLLQGLTALELKQAQPLPRQPARGAASDGRRRFGVVRDAIVAVLAETEGELRARDIHVRVEELLAESVSRGSVKSYLRVGCRRKRPLFEYLGR